MVLTCFISLASGRAALQNIRSRESASSRIRLRVLVSDSSFLTESESGGCGTQNTSCSLKHTAAGDTNIQNCPIGGAFFGPRVPHLAETELLQGRDSQGAEGRLHLAEQSTALQDLLLQSLEVVDVAEDLADGLAAMATAEGTLWDSGPRGQGCQENQE